ncbi:uncharacterized protein LOC125489824 isoform X1 [Plutella xylostella]|uniref:uncharacterized protein LOC125489824 isoform X1 n=1 Tax=Plutella xylostella TaxID=51655 RepID=UPI0020331597|nr:uncharacterized protein LOC125489824 isoform X1 [Plutella xylostella]
MCQGGRIIPTGWWCLVTLTLITLSQAHHLLKIEKNPGVLPVKRGHAYKQEDKWIIIKVLDLSDLYKDLVFNIDKYNEFSKLVDINKPNAYEFFDLRKQVDFLKEKAISKSGELTPTRRFKRGIINPLGSLIKVITGNLDNQDAIRYESLISQLKGNQIITDKKIMVISKMMDSFINSTETLHENTLTLDARFKKMEKLVKTIANKETSYIYSVYILSMFNMFLNNFRTIHTTIQEIETALAFSKLSVLHQSIVNSTELLSLLQSISKNANLMYPATLENLVNLEKTIIVKSYVKESQITFIMEVPLIDNNTYSYYQIYSLPIYNSSRNITQVIIPKHPYLLVKGSEYLPVQHPCEQLASDDQFLCTEDSTVLYSPPTCVEQLMKFSINYNACTPYAIDIETIKVQRIDSTSWILYAREKSMFSTQCQNDITHQQIQGTYILTISNILCDYQLENFYLHHRQHYFTSLQYKALPIIDLPELPQDNVTTSRTVNVKGVNLDNLRQMYNTLQSEISENSENISMPTVQVKSVSLATLILYFLLIICAIGFSMYSYRVLIMSKLRNSRNQESSSNFDLGDGGVMNPQPLRVIQVRA